MVAEGSEELVVYVADSVVCITNQKLGMAIAHVSAQAQDLAEYQVQLHASQQVQAQQQQLYTEARVQQVLVESETRTEALVETIRATQIDPAAFEQHVNSKLQSAISAANDVAQNQARAVAEAHVAHHAQVNDAKLENSFSQLRDQLHASLEQRMRERLAAHMDPVGEKVRLAIATQGHEMQSMMEKQMDAIQAHTAMQTAHAKSTAENKAKSIVRRHHAEEHAVHEEVKVFVHQAIAKCTEQAVEAAERCVRELLPALTTQKSSYVGPHSAFLEYKAVISPQTARLKSSMPLDPDAGAHAMSSNDDKSLSSEKNNDEGTPSALEKEPLELMAMLRSAKSTTRSTSAARSSLQDIRKAEQDKVVARVLYRSRTLMGSTKVRSIAKPKTKKLPRDERDLPMPESRTKRRGEERKALAKQNALKLASIFRAHKVPGKAKTD